MLAYFKIVPLPAPGWNPEGVFIRYFLWETGDAPEGICHNIVWGLNALWGFETWGLSILRHSRFQVQVFLFWKFPGIWGSGGVAMVSCDSLYSQLSFRAWGQQFALCPLRCYGSKKSCRFFGLFISLLVVRTEWWLLQPLA